MICVCLFGEAYSKVVHYERKHDVACNVSEETRGVGALDVAVCAEMPDKTSLAELAGLGKAVHAFSDFKIDVLVVQ